MRIRRHESLPCYGLYGTNMHSSAKAYNERGSNCTCVTTSVLIGQRLGSTKSNPYVGSFRHSPPTSLRSMAVSSLPSLSSRKNASSSSFFSSPSFAFAANSPYVGWFRHAPPVFSSYQSLGSRASLMNRKNKKGNKLAGTTRSPRDSLIVQHKVNSELLLELNRWHEQLTSLFLGVENEVTDKNPPLLLRQIINGRLLGGSGKDDRLHGGSSSSSNNKNSIIQRCNNINQSYTSQMPSSSSSIASGTMHHPRYKSTVLSRLTSWLLFPLIYADDECFDDYGCLNGDYDSKKTSSGLKVLLSKSKDYRSIEIDSDETDDDDDNSSASSVDYDTSRKISVPECVTPEMEREFSVEANLSVSEIAEAYYAHQLLDERRRRSNSDATTTSQQSGLSPSSLHHASDYTEEEEIRQRLDYEITQMDIARMTRNASRHLDVDSILNLPTIIYRKRPNNTRSKLNIPQYDQSYHHISTPIHESRSETSTQGSIENIKNTRNDETVLSEDGWSFMMVSDMKPSGAENSMEKSNCSLQLVASAENDKEICVICQEPFRDGDRLRVLPCNHSFHVGCIDRWLTGSHSHNECFTAGCPTCKKRPVMQSPSSTLQIPILEGTDRNEDDMSGSLPSWAFANLGSVLAMSTGDF